MQVVTDPTDAEFILAHGTEALGLPGGATQDMSLAEMQQLLEQCAQQQQIRGQQLPMIVANPDLVSRAICCCSFAPTVNGAVDTVCHTVPQWVDTLCPLVDKLYDSQPPLLHLSVCCYHSQPPPLCPLPDNIKAAGTGPL